MAEVSLLLPAHPEHVRTARLVVVAAARRAGLDDGLVDELRLAVGEACARAVGLHQGAAGDGADERIEITVRDDAGGLRVAVTDRGGSSRPDALEEQPDRDDLVDPDLSLALITGLVDRADITAGADGTGTVITLTWPLPPSLTSPSSAAATAQV